MIAMIKKTIVVTLILLTTLSCSLFGYPPAASGDKDFPLVRSITFPVNGTIRGMAVGDTWLAYHTMKEITAIDLDTQKVIWRMDFPEITSEEGFQIIDDQLVASSRSQIISLDRQGNRDDLLTLKPADSSEYILKVVGLYQNYAYVILGPMWTLEAYDIANKVALWKADRMENAYYDPLANIVYAITRTGNIQAVDNNNGTTLWQRTGNVVQSAYSADTLFLYEHIKSNGCYELSAFDVKGQQELWRTNVTNISADNVYRLTVRNQLLIVDTESGLLAFDVVSGMHVWTASVGEPIETSPIEFNNLIYAKGVYNSAIYALSPTDGSIIGVADMEKETLFGFADIYTGVYKISHGIVFGTKNSIFVYKPK
jgi:outer membrane protein assembly factor BamB